MSDDFKPVGVVVPAGVLGGGISLAQVQWGLDQGAEAIAVDAGSTDSGPSCLATGISKMSRDAIKRDLAAMIRVALPAGKPILVGTCGTAGTDAGVDWTHAIVMEIAAELKVSPKVALIYSEQSKKTVLQKLSDGKISALAPSKDLEAGVVEQCEHIVALLGPEPYIEAVQNGADIVLGGRTTDTAILAAVPLMLGAGKPQAWHAAKIAECGGLCTENPREGGVLITIGKDHFDVCPLNPDNVCTVYSVSAHMLYENSDPHRLVEPGGVLEVEAAVYEKLDGRTVRVRGSEFVEKPYTMKLEGAGVGPYQTMMIVGIQDPTVLGSLEVFMERMHERLSLIITETFPGQNDWTISLRPYGWNAVSGDAPPDGFVPREVLLMLVVTAPTQDIATRMTKACNSTFFHFPIKRGIPLPSYGFPFSPAEIQIGQVYEFLLNHVVEVSEPGELVRVKYHFDARENAA
ncbi:acyclic terpene utilization AtuA family protein [Martelella soudanensis]|uniref:acyclic terpene utilization AtuA family protein n=1 Tax=unclassified Martelella TaxID=2629616 RepID=UPI0015DD94B6|nr:MULTISPECIES: acyclic terpene utilization AtuA family protein [unclassified Martelella]